MLRAKDGIDVFPRLVKHLSLAQSIYFTTFTRYILPLLDPSVREQSLRKLKANIHGLFTFALPANAIFHLLSEELTEKSRVILGISGEDDENDMELDQRSPISYNQWKQEPSAEKRARIMEVEDLRMMVCRQELQALLRGLQNVGFGGSKGQKVFAEVMNNMMTEFVTSAYANCWEAPSLVIEHLRLWTENLFCRLIVKVLDIFYPAENKSDELTRVTLRDLERWQEMGIARVGALRITELFDIIVDWDASSGAIENLKSYTTNPDTRLLLTNYFTGAVSRRLLQPGASTTEILHVYISIIRAFSYLDARGVLLDRVSRPIRRYLREREDTIKVIVGGLLADETDANGQPVRSSPDRLVELAGELSRAHEREFDHGGEDLDWNDMDWQPDPIDAAPGYKKSSASDVIGSLISLFENKDTFVVELQKALAGRLLGKHRGQNYRLEISVLELLKLRFGESALQACEVMLRDMLESKRVDTTILLQEHYLRQLHHRRRAPGEPDLHARILSHLYWPPLPSSQAFSLPGPIAAAQEVYAHRFATIKRSRRLTFLPPLGQVVVELDLADRVFHDTVSPAQATVIYAFSDGSSSSDPTVGTSSPAAPTTGPVTGVQRTVTDLAARLSMRPALVRAAALFWIGRQVLVQTAPDAFAVLERLPVDDGAIAAVVDDDIDVDVNVDDVTKQPAAAASASTPRTRARAVHAQAQVQAQSQVRAQAQAQAQAEAEAEAAAASPVRELLGGRADLYWQFIIGMLTNQGAMPLTRIVMLLRMVVPGGFPGGSAAEEELREYLGGKVTRGVLEVVGGNYRIVPGALR